MSITPISSTSLENPKIALSQDIRFKGRKQKKTYVNEKTDASNDNKFTKTEAFKNFGKGFLSPITALVKHPILTIGTLAITGIACAAFPILTPVLTVGFGALSLYEIGKGTYKAVKEYSKGNYDNSEKAFEQIGTGTVGTLLTILGIKKSAQTANELKYVHKNGYDKFTKSIKQEITENTKKQSVWANIKDNLSVFTTKEGRATLIENLNFKTFINRFKGKNKNTEKLAFSQSAEGKRRAAMSTEDIEQEVIKVVNRTFDEMGIPKEARPKIVIMDELKYSTPEKVNKILSKKIEDKLCIENWGARKPYKQEFFSAGEDLKNMTDDEIINRIISVLSKEERTQKYTTDKIFLSDLLNKQKINAGGYYSCSSHEIIFKTSGYRQGKFKSIEEIASHEALHAKMAILRNSLSKEETAQIVKQELLKRIINGESEQIIAGSSIIGTEMMDAPKMSSQMKSDFYKFAIDFLYKDDKTTKQILNRKSLLYQIKHNKNGNLTELQNKLEIAEKEIEPIIEQLKIIIKKNPDFLNKNKVNEEEALNLLLKYSVSHNLRYKTFSNTKIDNLKPFTLTEAQHQEAIESLIGQIETVEGNARTQDFMSSIFGSTKKAFNQYQFSYEELLARNTAAKFEKENILKLLKDGNLSKEKIAELTNRIEELDFVFEYNKVGKQYYDLYIEHIHNPNDKAIETQLKNITKEFEILEMKKHKLQNNDVIEKYATNITGTAPYNILPYIYSEKN